MKIEHQADGITVITHFPILISVLILLSIFGVIKLLVAPLLETPLHYDELFAGIIMLLFCLVLAHFLWERIRFEFDPRCRMITWQRHRLFTGTASGQIAFDEVTDVIAQIMTSSDYNSQLTRVALVTGKKTIPLTRVYGGGNNGKVVQAIRKVIGLNGARRID